MRIPHRGIDAAIVDDNGKEVGPNVGGKLVDGRLDIGTVEANVQSKATSGLTSLLKTASVAARGYRTQGN